MHEQALQFVLLGVKYPICIVFVREKSMKKKKTKHKIKNT